MLTFCNIFYIHVYIYFSYRLITVCGKLSIHPFPRYSAERILWQFLKMWTPIKPMPWNLTIKALNFSLPNSLSILLPHNLKNHNMAPGNNLWEGLSSEKNAFSLGGAWEKWHSVSGCSWESTLCCGVFSPGILCEWVLFEALTLLLLQTPLDSEKLLTPPKSFWLLISRDI